MDREMTPETSSEDVLSSTGQAGRSKGGLRGAFGICRLDTGESEIMITRLLATVSARKFAQRWYILS